MSWMIVTLDFPPAFTGGVASWAADLALALTRAGEEVTVLAAGPAAPEHDAALPYPVLRARGRSWARWGALWMALAGYAPLRRAGPTLRVVFATWPIATKLSKLVIQRDARFAVAFHGSDLSRHDRAPAPLRELLNNASARLPVSAFLASELERLGLGGPAAGLTRVLPMPLSVDQPPQPRGEALLCVARLTPLKGVERAARLADRLGRPLELVGDGPEEARLRQRLAGMDVRWRGRMERARIAEIPAAAAVLLPRAEGDGRGAEGLGLVLVEAALRGLPAIGCRTGGVPEAVGPGLILEDPDTLDGTTLEAARALLADPGAGARARAAALTRHGASLAVNVLREALPARAPLTAR